MANWPYNTAAWQRLRKAKLSRDPLCEDCQAMGRITPANHVDHCHAISDGGDAFPPLDELSSKCGPCHSAKTARGAEAGAVRTEKARKGCNSDGSPLDPLHPWTTGGSNEVSQVNSRRGSSTCYFQSSSDSGHSAASDAWDTARPPTVVVGGQSDGPSVPGQCIRTIKSLRADAKGPPRNYNFELVSGGPTDGR